MNEIVKSCIVLFVISSVCVTALAYVNEITKEPIRLQNEMTESIAYQELFTQATEFKADEKTVADGGVITGITTAYANGERLGEIVKVAQGGYGGTINMMVGINVDGTISAIRIISQSETPGLGASCEKSWFTDLFKGKSQFPLSVIKSGDAGESEINAIASATITSQAVVDAVNAAYEWAVTEGGIN